RRLRAELADADVAGITIGGGAPPPRPPGAAPPRGGGGPHGGGGPPPGRAGPAGGGGPRAGGGGGGPPPPHGGRRRAARGRRPARLRRVDRRWRSCRHGGDHHTRGVTPAGVRPRVLPRRRRARRCPPS